MGLCILIGFGAVSTWAQITQGSISISVTDQNGAMLQGADVVLQDLATNTTRNATTGPAGTYTFAGLPTGNYRLKVTKAGFETHVFESVAVSATRMTDLKAALKVGAVNEQVVVSAEEIPVLEIDSNAITGTIDMRQVEDLHAAGRGPAHRRPRYLSLIPSGSGVCRRNLERPALHGNGQQRGWRHWHHAAHEVRRRGNATGSSARREHGGDDGPDRPVEYEHRLWDLGHAGEFCHPPRHQLVSWTRL
ncbi:MAG: hypothetical protein DMG49_23250 [Acidobacteria bacterium]|nr:MAG: hypothetical protein DMG49_23250 [Acidobacteriota bacterium]